MPSPSVKRDISTKGHAGRPGLHQPLRLRQPQPAQYQVQRAEKRVENPQPQQGVSAFRDNRRQVGSGARAGEKAAAALQQQLP
jgi:hypothetical protein